MSATTAAFTPASPTQQPEFPKHVVTAVLVSHDGARWLPDVLAGLLGQERPVQNVIAADTGSADDSARLVTEAIGDDRVLHLARRTGFGAAVDEAARTAPVLGPEELPYLKRPSGWDPVSRTWRDEAYDMPELPHGEPVQWLWLLHDDAAPEPGALAELLRVADGDEYAAIVGPKLRGWYDRKQLLEVGVSIANSGRRWTGLDRREQDQGQHDQVRSVLSVSSAGMLIRRDVFEELGGFDRRLPLMRDDVDLCWRAHCAGHRVLVAPDAVLRHAEASARERRTVDCVGRSVASPHRVDKAGAVYTLLANARGLAFPWVLLRLVVGTLLRTLAYLVGKAPGQAVDEVMGLFGTLLRPERIIAARRRRKRRAVEASELRALFPPPGATVRATVEQVMSNFGGSDADSGGSRHGAVESGPGGDDADYLEIEQFARLKKIARKPGPVLFALLLVVSVVACRGLFGGGSLAGGALLPVPDGVGELWGRYAEAWHPLGTGGTQTAPPYLAVLAALSAVFLGSTGLALTVLLVCSVPLAGITAYFASRSLVQSRLLRAWGAVAYAFLPAATGALATGRLGTAVLAVLLPLIARAAVAAHGLRGGGRGSWRATWAYAFLLTFTMAFTPVVWPLAVVLGAAVLVLRRDDIVAYGLRFVAAVGTPLLLLAPWSLSLLTDPAAFFKEAGMAFGTGAATPLDLLGVSPGGPKAAGGLVLIGLVLAALAALLRAERQFAIRTAWVTAVVALVFAVLVNGSGDGSGWAGPATLVYGIALLAAGMLGAEGGRTRVASQSFGWRQPVAVLIALAAAAGPVICAAGWMIGGAAGPLERRDPVQVPAFVAEESGTRDQPRTLVLGGASSAEVPYTLLRGSGARLGDAELAAAGGGDARLDKVVAHLVAGSGADQTDQLSGFAIRYVLVRDGAPRQMSRVLDATPGLTRLSQLDGSALWRVDRQVARATIVPGGDGKGERLPVASGPVEAHTEIPSGGDGRVLRIADRADDGWQATIDGRPLKKTVVDGWAQGFELPAEGGRLDLTYDNPVTHTAWVWTQVSLAVVLLVLALPGRRRDVDDDLPEEEQPAVTAEDLAGDGRRARRLRAAAAEAAEGGPETASGAEPPAGPVPPPVPPVPDTDPYAAQTVDGVPQQPSYGEWADGQAHAAYPADPAQQQYQADPYYQQQYPQYGQYEQYQQPYEQGQYDQGQYEQGQYDQQYPPGQYEQQQGYGYEYDNEQRPDGSSNQ
ncbi:family 2 glycosyl transferase [Streptomyces sp. CB03234]|uniref:glycosyltransferase family 2 protein n=1 Tax=Streptomyces sp. (strain CB03234) TaxID=1703937 RepID=UPI00093A1B36|nr:glycosyltransferase [Streptomyces sp. CB03234]OKJ99829.1 family 2 glycosyl transferase [Streptomyces sp. CB03234]